jgi:hypothetical protein
MPFGSSLLYFRQIMVRRQRRNSKRNSMENVFPKLLHLDGWRLGAGGYFPTQAWHLPGVKQRGFATGRGSNEGDQVVAGHCLQEVLSDGFAAKEEAGVFLAEGVRAGIRAKINDSGDGAQRRRAGRSSLNQPIQAARVSQVAAQVYPGLGKYKGRG